MLAVARDVQAHGGRAQAEGLERGYWQGGVTWFGGEEGKGFGLGCKLGG